MWLLQNSGYHQGYHMVTSCIKTEGHINKTLTADKSCPPPGAGLMFGNHNKMLNVNMKH